MKAPARHFPLVRHLAAVLLLALPIAACGDSSGVLTPLSSGGWKQVAPTNLSTCGIREDGRVYCWARSEYGYVTQGYVQPDQRFTALSAGNGTCGLTTVGDVYCWRYDGPAMPLMGGIRFRKVTGGSGGGCGIATSGATLCWDDALLPSPLAGDPGLASISMGFSRHGCGLTSSGEAWCWGDNTWGQLGDATYVTRSAATRVATDQRFVEIRTGSRSTCARTADGKIVCWGDNTDYQLGSAYSEAHGCSSKPGGYLDWKIHTCSTPQPVATSLRFTALAVQGVGACALVASGKAYCWGANQSRSLGVPDSIVTYGVCRAGSDLHCTPVPTAVAGDNRYTSIGAAGAFHECGIVSDGSAYCWGDVDDDGYPDKVISADVGPVPPVRLPEPAA